MQSSPSLIDVARLRYQSQIAEALATLSIYNNNSVGIGEHSDLLAEVMKYVDLLDSAESKLATLDKYFPSGKSN